MSEANRPNLPDCFYALAWAMKRKDDEKHWTESAEIRALFLKCSLAFADAEKAALERISRN